MKKLWMIAAAMLVLLLSPFTRAEAEISGDKDCKDFSTKQEVMEFWHSNGYSASYDPHDLDRDNDGLPCEVTKGEYDQFLATKTKTGWVQQNGAWYYYTSARTPYKGWLNDRGSWYFLDRTSGAMKTGWVKDGSSWYYLQSSGAMKTGWLNDGGSWYYLQGSGAMKTGWLKDSGSWYYLQNSGAMKTGWLNDGGSWYYLQNSGAMKTGWLNDGGSWYYLQSSGVMKTGWLQLGQTWYYLQANGMMAVGFLTIDGTRYYFDLESGALVEEFTSPYTDEALTYRIQPIADEYGLDLYVSGGVASLYDNDFLYAIASDGFAVADWRSPELAAELAAALDCPLGINELVYYSYQAMELNETIEVGSVYFAPAQDTDISIYW